MPRVRSDAAPVRSIRTADYVDWTPVEGKRDSFFRVSPRRGMGPTRHYATLQDTIELDYEFGYFLGLYIAEGGVDRGHAVSWYLHENEQDLAYICAKLIEKYTGKEATVRTKADRPDYHGVEVSVSSVLLAQLLSALCGTGARNKHLPGFVFEAPAGFMQGIFYGVLADRHRLEGGREPSRILREMVEKGDLGRKSGRGFYEYPPRA